MFAAQIEFSEQYHLTLISKAIFFYKNKMEKFAPAAYCECFASIKYSIYPHIMNKTNDNV